MKSNIEIIREKVISAVPEILELKFGCELKWGGGTKYQSVILFSEIHGGICVLDSEKIMGVRPNQVNKILGRPIRQDDCALIVKDKHGLADRWTSGYLQDQSKETIEWIVDNLVDL